MQYVICYDIADDGRRSRVANALLDYGTRVQESVFVANLDEELAERMRQRVGRLIEAAWDRVHIFALCGACEKRTVYMGSAEKVEDAEFYVV